MAKKCQFKFYSQSDKTCVYPPSIGSEYCIWHDPSVKKDEEFVRVRLKSAIKETGGDLEGFLMRKADLSEMNLRDVDLRDADLREANLDGADCRGGDFRGAKLNRVSGTNTNFEGANFMAANLNDGVFTGANFKDCNLRIVNLGHANINSADFGGSDVRNTDFSKTDQDEQTSFFNVVGVTPKIVLGEGSLPMPPAGPPPTASAAPPVDAGAVTPSSAAFPAPPQTAAPTPQAGQSDMVIPGAVPPAAGADPLFDTGEFAAPPSEAAAAEGEPFSDIFDESDLPAVSPPAGDEPMSAPLTKRDQAPTVDEDSTVDQGLPGLDGETDVTGMPPSEDETDYGLSVDSGAPLTMKHKAPVAATLLKGIVLVIVLAAVFAGGVMVENKLGLAATYLGQKPTGTGGDTSKLEARIKELEQALADAQASGGGADPAQLTALQKKIEGLSQQIAAQGKELNAKDKQIKDLIAAAEGGGKVDTAALAALKAENASIKKKVLNWEKAYNTMAAKDKSNTLKLLKLATESSSKDGKIAEITLANKKLMTEKASFEERLNEGKEIINAYKKKLADAEKAATDLAGKVKDTEDPFLKANPDARLITWGQYGMVTAKSDSYIVGAKFGQSGKGQFLHSDLLILGKAPIAKPKFSISFFDAKGNSLPKVLKMDLSKQGVKFQQVKLENRGWRNREAIPKYFKVEFLDG